MSRLYNDTFSSSKKNGEFFMALEKFIKNDNHTGWLTFMMPRLLIARDLLREDGVIFISIDDNEQAQLKILMDAIFGADNFITMITLESTVTQGMKVKAAQKGGKIVKNCEYIIVYTKTNHGKKFNPLYTRKKWDTHYSIHYNNGRRQTLLNFLNNCSNFQQLKKKYNIENLTQNLIEELYNTKKFFKDYIHSISDNIYRDAELDIKISAAINQGEIMKYKKYLIFKNSNNRIRQLLPLSKALGNTDDFQPFYGLRTIKGNLWKEFHKDMMNIDAEGGIKFPNGKKPIRLIKHILKLVANPHNDDIILDFFAGSGTTGHAVLEKNLEDKQAAIAAGEDPTLVGNRKYIIVQLDEKIDESKNSRFKTVFDICHERLQRAGNKINAEKGDINIGTDFDFLDLTRLTR